MDYVYAVVEHPIGAGEPELIVLPRETVEDLADIVEALKCRTWGEVREEFPARYPEFLGLAGYGSFDEFAGHLMIGRDIPGAVAMTLADFDPEREIPSDDDPFDQFDLGAVNDGDFPPHMRYLMNLHLPGEVIDRWGARYETTINGTFAKLDADSVDDVVAYLLAAGHECTEDAALVTAAIWGG